MILLFGILLFMMAMEVYSRDRNQEAASFYDVWYERGYMDEWPIDKKERVFNVIKNLDLPETGKVLDYGCGNGEFTGVLKKALPKWDVYGTDISSVAIENARKRHSDCLFFLASDGLKMHQNFDFLFTHHVLEHVDDIYQGWVEMDKYLKKASFALHILPCGNEGSFEYNLCLLKKDGIEKESGNRFYFEERSHLRRLTTGQMNELAAGHGFSLSADFYSNQFYGAVNWITLESPKLILEMTGPIGSKDKISALKLIFLRWVLLIIKLMRFPANTIDFKKGKMKMYKYYLLSIILSALYPLSKLTNIYLKHKSNAEWANKKRVDSGSEMYMCYTRN